MIRYVLSESQLEFLINAMSMTHEEIENIINATVGDIALQGAIKNNSLYIFAPNMRVWTNVLYINAPNIEIEDNKLIIS